MKLRTGPGPAENLTPWTGSDQDRELFENLGSNRTRTNKFPKILDRAGPGSTRFGKSRTDLDRTNKIWKTSDRTGPTEFRKSRTEPDQDQQNLENLGPNRTRTNKI